MSGLRYEVRGLRGNGGTEWNILDRAYNYRLVRHFPSAHGSRGELKARELCLRMNIEERRWEKNP